MATETKTKPAVEAVVEASTKIVALIITLEKAKASYISKKRALAEGIKSEAARQAYDRKQANAMAVASWFAAFNIDMADEKAVEAFGKKSRPDIAKIMSMAFPSDVKAEKELNRAYLLNDKLKDAPKQERIGENNLLRIARGEVTVDELLKVKAEKKKEKTSTLDSTTTPVERWTNSVIGIIKMHHVGEKGKITKNEALSAFQAQLDLIK